MTYKHFKDLVKKFRVLFDGASVRSQNLSAEILEEVIEHIKNRKSN
jgi:hypothetical protein